MNTIKHHQNIVKAYPIKVSMLHQLHDNEGFYQTKPGKDLVWLKDRLYDLKSGDENLFSEFISSIAEDKPAFERINQNVVQLLKEKEYLGKIAEAISKEDHSCRLFSHFVENLEGYIDYIRNNFNDRKLAGKLEQQKHLLNTIYYKKEIEHFTEIVHSKDCVNLAVSKFGERGRNALHHLVKSHNDSLFGKFKFRGELLKEVADALNSRAEKLGNAARWYSERILEDEISKLQSKIARIKRQSLDAFNESAMHYKKISRLHDMLLK